MVQKTKKQHYVPQCYLKAWRIENEKHQVYTYDEQTDMLRINNIADVASERYFYDMNLSDLFQNSPYGELFDKGIIKDEKTQGIENTLSTTIEKPLAEWLEKIICDATNATPWHIRNCIFITPEKKTELSAYLAIQYIRTKSVRNSILNSADCLIQVLADMGVPKERIEEYTLSEDRGKMIHNKMLMDEENLNKIAHFFERLTWTLGINKTPKKLYTSDNPIGTRAHITHPFLSMSGLACRGIEVFYPISPFVVLMMVDGTYHTHMNIYKNRYIIIDKEANIDYYNSILAVQAERFVFSSDGDIRLLKRMKEKDPDVFRHPHNQSSWGGKTYYPRTKRS